VRVVRCVQRLGAELKLDSFRERKRAIDAHIRLKETRTTKVVPASGAESLRQHDGAGDGIEHITDIDHSVGASVEVRVASTDSSENRHRRIDLIRNLSASCRTQVETGALNYIQRQSTHDAHHAAHLEAAQNLTRQALMSPPLALAERQVID